MKRLFLNVTIRELLCFTVVAAVLTHWGIHRSRMNAFADTYAQLQESIEAYEERVDALTDLRVALSEESDVFRAMQSHNTAYPDSMCRFYFNPRSKRWHATLSDLMPPSLRENSLYSHVGFGAQKDAADALLEAQADYHKRTPSRVFNRVMKLVCQPCDVSYDEAEQLLKIEVALEDVVDARTMSVLDRLTVRANK